jgi:hypothetical protein
MFERAASSVIATAAACAAAALTVFATGFALYALIEPSLGSAGAAGIVALAGGLMLGGYALFLQLKAKKKAEEEEQARSSFMGALPASLALLTEGKPIATIGLAALGGFIATRHPSMMRDLLAVASAFVAGRR